MQKDVVNPYAGVGCLAASVILMSCAMRAEGHPLFSHPWRECAQTRQRTVIDYYNLLPSLGIGDWATRQEKRELLQADNHPVIDIAHDYLLVHPDSSPPEEIAVFRARGRAGLLAISDPDSECDYNGFGLYRLRHGRLQDVTSRVLPMPPDTDHLLYELPRFGTTIRVFRMSAYTESGRPLHHVFDLQWHGGRFVKSR